MRKICVVTGTRAEYGILSGLMRLMKDDAEIILQVIATNMHLSAEFGLTYREIERDGFTINKKVEMMLSSDTANATAKSVGLATIGFADAFEDLQPDMILVLGDRYEILSAATAALMFKIPVAHLHGGEITEGAYDDAIRHAITKLSHLHFTATQEYANRVIQLGEPPDRVFNVGALGIENIKWCKMMTKEELEQSLDFSLGDKFFVVTFHPVTLENEPASVQFENLLKVLTEYLDYKVIFTLPNSDTGGRIIIKMISDYVEQNKDRCMQIQSLGLQRYLSALKYCSGVLGNSSSGITEAPSFGVPTLDIGNRQKGRTAAASVFHCQPTLEGIEQGMETIVSYEFVKRAASASNPYEKEGTSKAILHRIKTYPLDNLIMKSFHDLTI